jgi:hypothetical protein
MQDCEEPMYPGTLVQKVEAKHHQDAAPADEQYENDGKKQPEYYEEDASEYHFGPANEKWVFRDRGLPVRRFLDEAAGKVGRRI